ncbi:malto-oligosyltrehalose synthase [Microbacterium fluvii]|uniref:Malto-oligosyltrehalose synthase n=1 Tax=Microbacterium fluvii TaxID=415215 RepID=A0ABW2HC97_9MICO|nr:malto-oligosyltrehalose synthase [Microbacterium fluvii]MCU4672570.1 malto-oligosyltrehalose synthase [Microbacterium fluvii]
MTRLPSSTYRLQITADFDLDAAADVVGYLRDLGVGAVYLSPLLQASAGSTHGYDVVDPSRVDVSRGGRAGLERLAHAAHEAGLDVVVDIVPNHMGVGDPRQNAWWWDVLARGRASRYAEAFDIDWDAGEGRVLLPILGAPLEDALGDVVVDADEGVVRYFEHELPLAEGTGAGTVAEVLSAQHWGLLFWRDGDARLNYRRFFTVTSLAGVRVEVPWVFDETHAEILGWVRDGLVDGLRIDHPDGLADPGGYLDRLDGALRSALRGRREPYVVVEKILEHAATDHPEALPGWWATDGTTGYDALAEIDRVLVDPAGERALTELDARLRAETGLAPVQPWLDEAHDTKRAVADTALAAEVARLVRELPASSTPDAVRADAVAELLACFPVYRSYLPAGRAILVQTAAEAARRRPDLAAAIEDLLPAVGAAGSALAVRFEQTTGPVMAKGVEDTAFYRRTRLTSLTEVGGDPSVFALDVDGLHRAFALRQAQWPHAMTTLSTHDTKRSEDARARIAVLGERPDRWSDVLTQLRQVATTGHGPFDNLLWQAVVGVWPASADRLHAYAEKAAREAKERTSWTEPDAAFESAVHAVVDAAVGPARTVLDAFVAEIAGFGRSNALSAKLLQLTGPGMPDVYQGTELWDLSLVDPDNRRPVDYDARRRMLADLDAEHPLPLIDDIGAAKLLVTSRALRLRRGRPELFTRCTPMTITGAAAAHAVAFDRGGAVAVATRLPAGLADRGGWGDAVLLRHEGPTVDVITGRRFGGGEVPMAEVLADYPVALLATEEES